MSEASSEGGSEGARRAAYARALVLVIGVSGKGREGIGSGARGSVRRTPRSVVLAGEVRGSTGRVEEGGRLPERARESA